MQNLVNQIAALMNSDRFEPASTIFAVLPVAILLLLSGCVSTKVVPVDTDTLSESAPSTITGSNRIKPDFAAYTAGKAAAGLIGAAAIIIAGNMLVAENEIEDPSRTISKRLTDYLSNQLSIDISESEAQATTNKATDFAQMYPSSDLVVDVETVNWCYIYYPSNWAKYKIIYNAKFRLIDTRSQKIVAEGFCSREPEDLENAPSREELLADNADLIKQELGIAADYCTNEFIKTVFN